MTQTCDSTLVHITCTFACARSTPQNIYNKPAGQRTRARAHMQLRTLQHYSHINATKYEYTTRAPVSLSPWHMRRRTYNSGPVIGGHRQAARRSPQIVRSFCSSRPTPPARSVGRSVHTTLYAGLTMRRGWSLVCSACAVRAAGCANTSWSTGAWVPTHLSTCWTWVQYNVKIPKMYYFFVPIFWTLRHNITVGVWSPRDLSTDKVYSLSLGSRPLLSVSIRSAGTNVHRLI
jgi:hypothetical protein